MTTVIGIDTKSRGFHWVGTAGVGVSYGSSVSKQEDQDLARAEVFRDARAFFDHFEPGGHVFCEAPLALQNGATTRLLCMAASAVYCGFVAAEADGFWYWVDPSAWKKSVLGGAPPRGMKHKPWIRQRCYELWPADMESSRETFDAEPDFYDAWCLFQHGRQVLDSTHGG